MSRMTERSDAEWYAGLGIPLEDTSEAGSRRRHPAGRARTPMDTAQDFHDELEAIDAQTGRVLPRRIGPDAFPAEPPAPAISRAEIVGWTILLTAVAGVVGWVILAVFYGWEGLV